MSFFVGNAKIKNGTINNSVIGGDTAAAGTFTTLTGSTVVTSAIDATSGLDLDVSGGALEIDVAGELQLESEGNIAIGADNVAKDINIGTAGVRTITVGSSNATATKIYSASTLIQGTANSSETVYIHANGGTSETIKIHADQGTGEGSINLLSDVGGITATASNGNISLDAAQIVTLTGKTITLNSDTTNGTINIDNDSTTSTINIGSTDGNKTINIDSSSSGSLDVDVGKLDMRMSSDSETNLLSLAGTTNIKVDNKNLTVDTGTGDLTLSSTSTATTAININASNGGDINIDARATNGNGGKINLDANNSSNLTVTKLDKTLTLSATGGGVNQVIVSSTGTGSNAIHLNASDTDGGIDIDAGTQGVDIDATGGTVAIDSTTGAIEIGVNEVATAINIGTKDDAPTVTIGAASINKDLTVTGNLTISGNTVTQNVETMVIEDPIIGLRKGGTNNGDGGFIIEQNKTGDDKNKAFIWDDSGNNNTGYFTMINTTTGASEATDPINNSGTLDLKMNTLYSGNIDNEDYLSIGGTSTLTGATTAAALLTCSVASGTGLAVSSDANIGGTLSVTGLSYLTTLETKGATDIAKDTDTAGAVTIAAGGGTVTIGKTQVATTIQGTLNVDEAVTLDTTLGVTGNVSFTNRANIGTTLSVAEDTTLTSTLSVGKATLLSSTLDVSGNVAFANRANINSTLSVEGDTTLTGALTGSTGSFSSTLDVSGNVAFANRANIGTTLSVAEGTTLTGALTGSSSTFSSTVSIAGRTALNSSANIQGTLSVQGATTLTGALTGSTGSFSSTLDVTGNVALTNRANIGTTLSVASYTTFGNVVTHSYSSGLVLPKGTDSQRADTGGSIRYNTEQDIFEGYYEIDGGSGDYWGSLGGVRSVDHGTQIDIAEDDGGDTLRFYVDASDDFNSGEPLMILTADALSVSRATTINNTLNVEGNVAFTNRANIASTLSVADATSLKSTLSVKGITTLTGALAGSSSTFSSTVSIAGRTALNSSANIQGTLSVQGDTTLTGALTGSTGSFSSTLDVTGNVAFANRANINSTLSVEGDTTLTGALAGSSSTFSSTVSIAGRTALNSSANIQGTLSVQGDTTLTGALTGSTGSFSSTLDVTGNVAFANRANIQSTLSVAGETTLAGITTGALSSTTGSFSSTLDVDGYTKIDNNLSISGNLHIDGNFYQHIKSHTDSPVTGSNMDTFEYHLLNTENNGIKVEMPTTGIAGEQASFIKTHANHEAYIVFSNSTVVLPGSEPANANLTLDEIGQGAMFIHNGTKWFQLNGGYSECDISNPS